MNPNYKIKLIRVDSIFFGWIFNKTIKAMGHVFINQGNNANSSDSIYITHLDKRGSYVSMNNYRRIEISKELFAWKAAEAERESAGRRYCSKISRPHCLRRAPQGDSGYVHA